ncbi:MAG: hypothetical protein WA892_00440 [Ornithinimicrobium sp.]
MPWRPGRGAQQRALEAAYEDVPPHLAQPLWNWINNGFWYHIERLTPVAIRMRETLPADPNPAMQELLRRCDEDSAFMLDLVEAMLELYGWDSGRGTDLRELLVDANSAYTVREDYRGLELRTVPEVKEQVQETVNLAAGSAGDHLRNAWNEAYGRHPDPTKAYSEAIKAVESAMAPVVSPMNVKATLGTILKDVERKPSKWEFSIADGRADGVDTVLQMMQMLWDGQTSRHGGVAPTRAETPSEAQAAVHLAATLVQFAVGKSFRPV